MKLLEGKTAVITGSSRGLGFAIAKAFAEQGASFVLAARTEATLHSAVAELKNQGYQAVGFAFGRLIAGVGKELWRWITRAPTTTPTIQVRTTDKELTQRNP